MDRNDLLPIGELAKRTGLAVSAIRFYEDEGLLAPARAGRQRIYEKRDRTRLGLILRGKRLGLSLAEIGELLDMYDGARNSALQLQRFLAVLAERRRVIEQQREDIVAVLGEIDRLEKQCTHLLAGQSVGVGPV